MTLLILKSENSGKLQNPFLVLIAPYFSVQADFTCTFQEQCKEQRVEPALKIL